MIDEVDWRQDPMVRLEKRFYPLVVRLVHRATADGSPDDTLPADLMSAADALTSAQARYFDAYAIVLTPPTVEQLAVFSGKLTDLAIFLDQNQRLADDKRWALWCRNSFHSDLESILDALRADFLGVVLKRQQIANRQSSFAAAEIAQISRQIYFISINASVEASRAGEAGRGISVIGEQIRTLAQGASSAMNRMKASESPGRNALASSQTAR